MLSINCRASSLAIGNIAWTRLERYHTSCAVCLGWSTSATVPVDPSSLAGHDSNCVYVVIMICRCSYVWRCPRHQCHRLQDNCSPKAPREIERVPGTRPISVRLMSTAIRFALRCRGLRYCLCEPTQNAGQQSSADQRPHQQPVESLERLRFVYQDRSSFFLILSDQNPGDMRRCSDNPDIIQRIFLSRIRSCSSVNPCSRKAIS